MAIAIQRKADDRRVASISMAPMIDMVFLLLVFFMTASAMSQAGSKLELELPESQSAKVSKDFSNRLIVSVDADGGLFIGTRAIEMGELEVVLTDFKEAYPEGKLSLRAAKQTPFEKIKSVMSLAASLGIEDYLYASFEAAAP